MATRRILLNLAAETLVDVTDYYDDTWANAITDAHIALVALGGGVLYFPDGDYEIGEGDVTIPSNITWRGETGATIESGETSVYNFLITVSDKTNVTIENMIFDQRGDSALLPTISPYKACGCIWFDACNNIDIHNCTFYVYGIAPIFVDDWDAASETTSLVEFKNNYVYWQRKSDTWYDASVTHIQTKTIEYSGNYIESVVTGFATHVARTGFECHSPNGYITNNEFKGCQVGALNNPWPSHWNYYDSEYVGAMLIDQNTITNGGAMGFELWLGLKGNGRDLKNLTIENNTIGLYMKNNGYSKPGSAITFFQGGAFTAEAYDIDINNNDINLTYDTGYAANLAAVSSVYYLLQYGEDTGAFNFNVDNNLHDINVYENTVDQFPYSLLNLYRRSGGGADIHEDVNFYDNTSTDSHYATPYDHTTQSEYCFTIGYATSCEIKDNAMDNTNIAIVGEKEELAGVVTLTYTGNTFV